MLAVAFKLSLRGQKHTFCVHSPVKTFIWAPTRLSFDLRDHIPRTEFFVTRSKTAPREVASLTFFFGSYTAGETPTVVRYIKNRELYKETVQRAPQRPKKRIAIGRTSKKLGDRAL